MPSRRLEDRIRDLCAKALAADDPAELEPILNELRDALREHVNHVRRMVAERALKSIRHSQPTANQDPS